MAEHRFAPENPFNQPSILDYQAPPFDIIRESDYAPAIDEGIRLSLLDVARIADDPAPPTFANTYQALEQSGKLLKRVLSTFGAMISANSSDLLQQIEEAQSPKLSALNNAIHLNARLFARLKTLYQQRERLELTSEQDRVMLLTYRRFELAGANLSADDKQRLMAINQEAATLSTRFSHRLLAATTGGALTITDREALAGLSEPALAAAREAALAHGQENGWRLMLYNTTQQPQLQHLAQRDTRQALFHASIARAEQGDDNDIRALITRLASLRAQQAQLLGFADYASWAIADQMAKTPQAAVRFMQDIVPAAVARARREAADIQALIDAQRDNFTLAAWDWQFYAEQVRKQRYDLDDANVRPYFALDNVLHNGVFYAATQLYGITFQPRHDIPVYHPDVNVYEIFDEDRTPLALFYTDLFARDNKSGGAWMGNFVEQSTLEGTRPVIYNVANFARPAAGLPALLSWDDVITLFHEFGHTLHGLFASQRYASISGTATPRDFVEFPSQFNEHWASEPHVFAHYARHYQTGAAMPATEVAKINQAARFNKGYDMTELLAAALLDMAWHQRQGEDPVSDVAAFEAAALAQANIALPYVPPRYRSSYFQHIWGGGYAAGYYA
ncbi:Dipeptidyl carboxypeptidase [Sodalis praecaptivus]|nr:Dipeptidyl carboxypeptidase [Sodalis praecaptivus]